MKNIIHFFICFASLIFFACDSKIEIIPNIEEHQGCIQHFLTEFDMKEYNGEPIPCGVTYIVMFENSESKFAILHNDCADLLPQMLIDCNEEELCIYTTDEGCLDMVQNSNRIGIIGIAN